MEYKFVHTYMYQYHMYTFNNRLDSIRAWLSYFLWSVPGQTVEQTIETQVILGAIALIMTSLWCGKHHSDIKYGSCRLTSHSIVG